MVVQGPKDFTEKAVQEAITLGVGIEGYIERVMARAGERGITPEGINWVKIFCPNGVDISCILIDAEGKVTEAHLASLRQAGVIPA